MDILFILALTMILALAALFINNGRTLGITNFLGHLAIAVFSLRVISHVMSAKETISLFNFFYVDSLSGIFILTISVLNIAASLYSIDYMNKDLVEGVISVKKIKTYYALFNLFAFSMFFVTVVNNLGMIWIAIEATTLTSAFLVGFHNSKSSIEAAWKYIIICSVGITLALFGTILFYYASSMQGLARSLNWTDMLSVASKLDPK